VSPCSSFLANSDTLIDSGCGIADSDEMKAVCGAEDVTSCQSHPPAARARSVLEKLIRLCLTDRMTHDQIRAVVELGDQLFRVAVYISIITKNNFRFKCNKALILSCQIHFSFS